MRVDDLAVENSVCFRSREFEMEQIAIGKSGLKTSRIGLGTWAIGGWMWGGTDEGQAIATIRSALERGVTLIDTAPVYGFGRSEEVVGKALADGGLRDKAQIATKVGLAWKDDEIYRDCRRTRVRREIEDSLRRLRTDVIDLYQVHWPDLETPIEETARALDDLRREGKIRAVGVSNYSPAQMDSFRAVAALDAVQPPYNLFEREIEADVLLALAVRWVLDQGPTIALWGARRPDQLDPVAETDGWQIDERTKADIDAILARCITDPVSPDFMAPAEKRPQHPA
jgi:aryl-alcohol dehydrogenase-like predicted oxidoreductase